MNHLKELTQEDREAIAQAREDKKDWALNNLKLEYADMPYWENTASELGVRLPQWMHPGTDVKYLKRVATKLGYDINIFIEETGFSSLKSFAQANNTYNARALCGILLESYLQNRLE